MIDPRRLGLKEGNDTLCLIPYQDGMWRAEAAVNGQVIQAFYRQDADGNLQLIAVDPEVLPA